MVSMFIAILGIAALVKGEFKISARRKVSGLMARALGVLLLIGTGAGLLLGGGIQFWTILLIIIIGFATAEKIDDVDSGIAE